VIDTKAIRGRVRVSRPLFGRARLLVGGRDRGHLVNGLDRQVAAVRAELALSGRGDVPLQGAFCFTKAELPLFGSSEIGGHRLCSERSLGRRLNAKGALEGEAIDVLARALASSFSSGLGVGRRVRAVLSARSSGGSARDGANWDGAGPARSRRRRSP